MTPLPMWWTLAAETSIALRAESAERGSFRENMHLGCGVAAVLLAMVYRHTGIDAWLGNGLRRWGRSWAGAHCWVFVAGHIVDLTATQFDEEAIVFVAPKTSRLYQASAYGPLEVAAVALRADPQSRARHLWHPRRHHDLLAASFSRVVGMPLGRARGVVTDTIGSVAAETSGSQ